VENLFHDSTRFERQVDLLDGFDAHGIPLLGGRLDLFHQACPHHLDHRFDLLLLGATRQEECRPHQENVQPH
jgi:hypothetical protein